MQFIANGFIYRKSNSIIFMYSKQKRKVESQSKSFEHITIRLSHNLLGFLLVLRPAPPGALTLYT